jgi:ankyrin repeat protein
MEAKLVVLKGALDCGALSQEDYEVAVQRAKDEETGNEDKLVALKGALDIGALSPEDYEAAVQRVKVEAPASGATSPATQEPEPGPEPEQGDGFITAFGGSAKCQIGGKGDFKPAQLELEGGKLTITGAGGSIVNVLGCTVAPPKTARKGHPHAFRLDGQFQGAKAEKAKLVFSVATAEDHATWTAMLAMYSGMSAGDLTKLAKEKHIQDENAERWKRTQDEYSTESPVAAMTAGGDLEKITMIATSLTGKDATSVAKILTSSLDRSFVMEGQLDKMGDHKVSPRHFFLFNDMMIFCRFNEKKGVKTYEPRLVIPAEELRDATLTTLANTEARSKKELAFILRTPKQATTLYGCDAADRESWLAAIKRSIIGLLGEDAPKAGYGVHHMLCTGTLHYAAQARDAAVLAKCLAAPDSGVQLAMADNFGATALHVAASVGNVLAVGKLLKAGARQAGAAVLDTNGFAPIHLAALGGHDSVLEVFAEHQGSGVDLELADVRDLTALQLSVAQQQMIAASIIVSLGADVDRQNKSGYSALHLAATAGAVDIAQQWIGLGADCNKPVGPAASDRHRGQPALFLAAHSPPDGVEDILKVLLDGGADPNASVGGVTTLTMLLEVDNHAAAAFMVRHGAAYDVLGEVPEVLLASFAEQKEAYHAEQHRDAEVKASLVSEGGAQRKAADGVVSGWMWVHGSTKWNRRFLACTVDHSLPEPLVLHRYDSDTALEPLQSVPLSTETCAIEKAEGREPGEFGLLISGVGQAATSRAGRNSLKAAFGKKLGQLAAGKNAGMYKLSVATQEEQGEWQRSLMRCGLGGDIEEAKRIEAEQKMEREAVAAGEKVAAAKQEEAAAERMAEELFAGASGGGGGAGDAFAQINDAKQTAQENIDELNEMAQKTKEMENNAMDFSAMARQLRQREEKKSKFF